MTSSDGRVYRDEAVVQAIADAVMRSFRNGETLRDTALSIYDAAVDAGMRSTSLKSVANHADNRHARNKETP